MGANTVQLQPVAGTTNYQTLYFTPSGKTTTGILTATSIDGINICRVAKIFGDNVPGLPNIIKYQEPTGWWQLGGIILPSGWYLKVASSEGKIAFTFDYYEDNA